jgi:hypothetical protein
MTSFGVNLPLLSIFLAIMSSIKLEHIPLLKGASNYLEWSRLLLMTLQSNGLWGYIQGDEDKMSPW